jgi:hypothetical protein
MAKTKPLVSLDGIERHAILPGQEDRAHLPEAQLGRQLPTAGTPLTRHGLDGGTHCTSPFLSTPHATHIARCLILAAGAEGFSSDWTYVTHVRNNTITVMFVNFFCRFGLW